MRPNELLQKRAGLAVDAQAILSKPNATAEDLAKGREMLDECDRLKSQADSLAASERLALELAAQAAIGSQPPAPGAQPAAPVSLTDTPEYRAAFRSFLAHGHRGMSAGDLRALSVGVGSQGGFTVASEQFSDAIIKFVDNMVLIRGLATKLRLPGAVSLGVPTLETDPADADWTTEAAVGNTDSSMAFGKRKMVPSPLAKQILISNDLLRAAAGSGGAIDIEQFVRARLGYKFGVSQEKAFLIGSGVNQPLGLFVASPDGVPTSSDVSTGNTTTAITFDGLIAARYSVKDQYRATAKWLFHRNAVAQIAGLKDSQNRYLWQPSLIVGQPDTLLGSPLLSSEYVPSTFTTGLYVGMFADFSFYWIADSLDLQFQRLVELYAATNQTGLIGRMSTDGARVLGVGFARVKLA